MLVKLKRTLLSLSVIVLFALYSVQAQSQNHSPSQPSIVSEHVATLIPEPSPSSSDQFAASVLTSVPAVPTATSGFTAGSTTGPVAANVPTSAPPEPTATSDTLASTTTNNASSGGAFRDGSYTGSPADASWGTVEVVAVISNGKISDVQFLQYPNHRNLSREINQQAMPMLTQEAIQSQQAQVDVVTGATDTSEAFIQSLSSALQQAA